MATTQAHSVAVRGVRRVGMRFPSTRQRLEWAVRFASDDWGALPPEARASYRVELAAILGAPAKRRRVRLLTDAEMQETHNRLAAWVGQLVDKGEHGKASLGRLHAEYRLEWNRERGTYALGFDFEFPRHPAQRAALRLALLMGHARHPLKSCGAPKAGGKPGERCGRWFVGRPNRYYCSLTCASRVTTRRARLRGRK